MRIHFLRLPSVIGAMGKCRSGVYADIKNGTLCTPIKLGPRAVGFLADEVDAVSEARIAGKTEAEIKKLVQELHAKRGAGLRTVEMKNAQVTA